MPVEHLTGRTSRRHWLLVALSIGLALAVALSMALAGDAEAKKKKGGGGGQKKAKKFNQISTVPQQNSGNFVPTGPPGSVQLTGNGTPYTFPGNKISKLKTVNNLKVKLTAAAFPGNPPVPGFGAQELFLELDGVNTGLKLNIPLNNGIPVAVEASGAPQDQAAVVAALKDGQASARILDQSNIAATGQTFVFVGTGNTSLQVQGTVKKKNKNKR
jgi:hypothetical protein